jgi:hypothetical protein
MKTPATLKSGSNGKTSFPAPGMAEDSKEEEEYEDWLKKNQSIRNSITDLPDNN